MKFKFSPLFFYSGFIMVAVAALIIYFSVSGSNNANPDHSTMNQMPDDDLHRSFKNPDMHGKDGMKLLPDVMAKLNELKAGIEKNPNDTLKMRELADFYFQSHKPDEALMYYNMILDKNPKRTDILHNITNLYYVQKDLEKAEQVTRQIISIDKDDVYAHYNLGAIFATVGKKDEARKIWLEILNKYPNNPLKNLISESLNQIK